MRWQIVIYRFPADTLSQIKCFSLSIDKIRDVHESLCHPGKT